MHMNPVEVYTDRICEFLGCDKAEFEKELAFLRGKGWQRWGGGTVEITCAELLYVITKIQKPNKVLELGTSIGYSGAHIAEALRDVGADTRLISVDLNPVEQDEAKQHWAQKNLDIQTECRNSEVPMDLGFLDMVFIDSSHTYEGTIREWKWVYPLLAKGKNSVALFHDAVAVNCGVNQFLLELQAKGHKVLILDTQQNTGFGIVRLADEFVDPRTKIEIETDEWLNG